MGGSSLPLRQRQLVYELRAATELDESTSAVRLATLMRVRYGVGASQTYDLLGALRRKGVIRLDERDEWVLVDA